MSQEGKAQHAVSGSWLQIAEEASKAHDSKQLSDLVAKLCDLLEEEQRTKKKTTLNPQISPKPEGPAPGKGP